MVGVLLLLDRRIRFRPPALFALYVSVYTFGRTFEEFLRIDPSHHVFGIRLNALVSIVLFCLSTAFFVWWQFLRKGHGARGAAAARRVAPPAGADVLPFGAGATPRSGGAEDGDPPRAASARPGSVGPCPPSSWSSTSMRSRGRSTCCSRSFCARRPLAEVDVAGIVLAFCEHLAAQGRLDLDACGEFLVLVSALLELKARGLFPDEAAELDELEPEGRRPKSWPAG